MKNSILIPAFIISSFFSFSQTITPVEKKRIVHYEVGMNLLSTGPSVRQRIPWQPYGDIQYLTGLYFRATRGKNVFRASLAYFKESPPYYGDPNWFYTGWYEVPGELKTAEVTLGYQRNFSRGRWVPYVYGDVVFKQVTTEGLRYYLSVNESLYGIDPSMKGSYYQSKAFVGGIAAGLGLKFKLNERISFLYEANLGMQFNFSDKMEWQYRKYNKYYYMPGLNALRTLGISFQF